MKTQTAIEWLEDCFNRYGEVLKTDFKKAKQMERNHTTTQIEALRERLVNHFKNFGYSYDVDFIVNKFLKEINDGK